MDLRNSDASDVTLKYFNQRVDSIPYVYIKYKVDNRDGDRVEPDAPGPGWVSSVIYV